MARCTSPRPGSRRIGSRSSTTSTLTSRASATGPGSWTACSSRNEYDLIWITVGSARILARRYSDTPQQASLMSIEEGGVRRFIHASDLTSPLVAAAVAYLTSIGVEDVQRLGGGSGYAPVDL